MLPGLKASGANGSPADLVEVNGRAFFAANDGIHGTELWVSDGTATGTRLVKDIRPAPARRLPSI